jgi:DNA-binding response OmpR family regulator
LRAIRPDLPVAFTSGRWDKDVETAAFDGTAIWIHKPATVEELSRALHGMLHRAH